MSILSALKAKGAKGKNIEEAVKTLPANESGSGVLFVNAIPDGQKAVLDHTWKEIHDAGFAVLNKESDGGIELMFLTFYEKDGEEYTVVFYDLLNNTSIPFNCDSEDGYPCYDQK